MARHGESELTIEKRPLVAELKLKNVKIGHFATLSISALPPEDTFSIYRHLGKKDVQIFDMWSGNGQNVAGGSQKTEVFHPPAKFLVYNFIARLCFKNLNVVF